MAVYTTVTLEEIRALLAPFELGYPTALEAVAAGIENTTYFLTVSESPGASREYVLTIGEAIAIDDMEFVASLTATLASSGLPVPSPILNTDGSSLLQVKGKPALLMPKIAGSPPLEPTVDQCHAAGTALANLHRVTLQLAETHESHRSLAWVERTAAAVAAHLPTEPKSLLSSSIMGLNRFVSTHKSLPQAIIHGDLFRDNTLFEGDRLVAIIDFFSAGNGYLIFDLAVAANDWAATGNTSKANQRMFALLAGYHAVRPLTGEEKGCWGEMLAIAALRFWVSRLADQLIPLPSRPSAQPKDPSPYEALLLMHRNSPTSWPESLE